MNIDYVTIPHPSIYNRDVTVLFANNEIDLPSMKFLLWDAKNGGRHGSIAGQSSHRDKAIRIGELYRHLDNMEVDWRTASEAHIKAIRNGMLCWDKNDCKKPEEFDYEPISNDVMNQKLGLWYKFYKFQESLGEQFNLIIRTKKIKRRKNDGMLAHLDKRSTSDGYMDVWRLRVKGSPKRPTFHAISRTEFAHLYKHLKNDDIVFAMLAYLMVETGLRVHAALNVTQDQFKGFFRHLSNGKTEDDIIEMPYLAKASEDTIKHCDLPLRTVLTIHKEYMNRIFIKRKKLHETRSDDGKIEYNSEALWILENGREVNYDDVLNAFKRASEKMGRKDKSITPHWLRHTFATWSLIDFAKEQNIPLENTGVTPNPMFILLLSQKLGHADPATTMKYIATALRLMGVGINNGPIMMSFGSLRDNLKTQEIIKDEARIEFGEEFDESKFDVFEYAEARGLLNSSKG